MPLGFFEKHLHRRAAGGHDAPASRQQDSTPSNSRKGKLRKARLREGALFPKGVFGFEEYFECFFLFLFFLSRGHLLVVLLLLKDALRSFKLGVFLVRKDNLREHFSWRASGLEAHFKRIYSPPIPCSLLL